MLSNIDHNMVFSDFKRYARRLMGIPAIFAKMRCWDTVVWSNYGSCCCMSMEEAEGIIQSLMDGTFSAGDLFDLCEQCFRDLGIEPTERGTGKCGWHVGAVLTTPDCIKALDHLHNKLKPYLEEGVIYITCSNWGMCDNWGVKPHYLLEAVRDAGFDVPWQLEDLCKKLDEWRWGAGGVDIVPE